MGSGYGVDGLPARVAVGCDQLQTRNLLRTPQAFRVPESPESLVVDAKGPRARLAQAVEHRERSLGPERSGEGRRPALIAVAASSSNTVLVKLSPLPPRLLTRVDRRRAAGPDQRDLEVTVEGVRQVGIRTSRS